VPHKSDDQERPEGRRGGKPEARRRHQQAGGKQQAAQGMPIGDEPDP